MPVCESCLVGKMTKRPFSSKGNMAKNLLELLHTNVCGPMNVKARGGYEYFITFTDDCFNYRYIYLMHRKSEALEKAKSFERKQKSNWVKVSRLFGQIDEANISSLILWGTCQKMGFYPSCLLLECLNKIE